VALMCISRVEERKASKKWEAARQQRSGSGGGGSGQRGGAKVVLRQAAPAAPMRPGDEQAATYDSYEYRLRVTTTMSRALDWLRFTYVLRYR
jgi:hypothetical protein